MSTQMGMDGEFYCYFSARSPFVWWTFLHFHSLYCAALLLHPVLVREFRQHCPCGNFAGV